MWYIQHVKQRVITLQKLSTTDFCYEDDEQTDAKGVMLQYLSKGIDFLEVPATSGT